MNQQANESVEKLTLREKQVFKYMGLGYSNPQIAAALCITISTVKAHVSSILSKLKVDNRSKVAVIASKYPDDV